MSISFRRSIAIVSIITVLVSILPVSVWAQPPIEDQLTRPAATPCTDYFACVVPKEIGYTDQFLRYRKAGLPYTPEPRPLTPTIEVLRLNVLSQTMAYLNLYGQTENPTYRREALDRVEYMYNLGDAGLGHGVRDGMTGYMFLSAYTITRNTKYLTYGLSIADSCKTFPERGMVMNGGLMCALNLSYAYKLTGDTSYRDLSRQIVQRTAPKQFADGAFPHLPSLAAGQNASYTSWMGLELLLLSKLDPQDPNIDLLIVRVANFIKQRVNVDGTLNYIDANGNYETDPGNYTPGSGHSVADIFAHAVNLYGTGHRIEAERALRYGFTQRRNGTNFGGYADVFGVTDPSTLTIWSNPNISVLRTSLIFWYMTVLQTVGTKCAQEPAVSCAVTTTNCNPQLASLGLCQLGTTGTQTCIAGRMSSCFNPATTQYTAGQACATETYCQDEGAGACMYTCTHYGSRVCVNGICGEMCYDTNVEGQGWPTCESTCYADQSCNNLRPAVDSDQDGGGEMCLVQ